MLSGLGDATISVKPGHSIQSAINTANPGQIIEVQNGTFHERINVTKSLALKGIGKPVIDAGGIGSAITISASSSTLTGFTVTGSGSGAGDAGIRIISGDNIIKDNTVVENNNYGIIIYRADKNTVLSNRLSGNKKGGILLVHSVNNLVWDNDISMNGNGITIETSSGNTIKSNNLTRNKLGINISSNNISESITQHGKGVSIKYSASSKLTTYKINQNSTSTSPNVNIIYQNNLQDNIQSAFDDGNNQWDNGKAGNHYSNYDAHEQGCTDRNRDGICDSGYNIPGGHNVDPLPKASPDAILRYKSKGLMGSELKIDHNTFLPDADINVIYTAPRNFSGWLGIMKADQPSGSQETALCYQKFAGSSGILKLKVPSINGSYDLRLYNAISGQEMASLSFMVATPTVSVTPGPVYTCEQITVTYAGAPGFENDWIGMYRSGSPDTSYVARQYLDGKENGTLILDAPDPGNYDFRMFENDTYTLLATSNNVTVKAFSGTKVVASPTHVAPGGTVTVTYWGAPASGTGIIGMYGMTRPDKFPLETRSLGSKSCGRMTWKLPYDPGQYDFRMFYSAITDVGQGAYQILGQSDVVTVG
ncbi:MAG: nitrous oxide reductase family maturation protein NosD [Methanotrichaceae archaeon]